MPIAYLHVYGLFNVINQLRVNSRIPSDGDINRHNVLPIYLQKVFTIWDKWILSYNIILVPVRNCTPAAAAAAAGWSPTSRDALQPRPWRDKLIGTSEVLLHGDAHRCRLVLLCGKFAYIDGPIVFFAVITFAYVWLFLFSKILIVQEFEGRGVHGYTNPCFFKAFFSWRIFRKLLPYASRLFTSTFLVWSSKNVAPSWLCIQKVKCLEGGGFRTLTLTLTFAP